MSDNLKVGVASFFGTATPAVSWFLENAEPVLQVMLVAGQVGVAAVTILYIVRKWKNAKITKKDE